MWPKIGSKKACFALDKQAKPLTCIQWFKLIVQNAVRDFIKESPTSDNLQTIHILANSRLKQLQAILTQLWGMIGKPQFSERVKFMLPDFGPCKAPNLMSLTSDYLFWRVSIGKDDRQYKLVACFMGETSRQQLKYFGSKIINVLGPYLNESQGLHAFVWDFSPSDPNKQDLWDAMYKSLIASKYSLQRDAITYQGFNPDNLAPSM